MTQLNEKPPAFTVSVLGLNAKFFPGIVVLLHGSSVGRWGRAPGIRYLLSTRSFGCNGGSP